METDTIREFLMLAEKRSYAATAEALFISPSALSRHIAALESRLGVELFHRNSRSVAVTRHGKMLIPFARKMVEIENEYLETLDRTKRIEGNGLRIGAFFGMASHGVMSQVVGFLRRNPEIALSVVSEEQDRLLDMLKAGEYDVVFVQENSPSGNDGFSRLTVALDRLVVVLPLNHLLADAKSIRLSQLRNEEFLLQPAQSMTYRMILDAFHRAGYTPKRTKLEIEGLGVVEMVDQGLGVALTQEKVARSNLLPGVSLVPLEPRERIWINLVWRTDALSPAGKALIAHFRDLTAGREK